MKRFYFVVALGKNENADPMNGRFEKYYAEVEYFTDSGNMLNVMEKLGGYAAKVAGLKPTVCHMCSTRKEAENLAEFWNDGWKKQGKLYDWFKEA